MTGRAKRDAAREATESISRNIQDEKNKLIKATNQRYLYFETNEPEHNMNFSTEAQKASEAQKAPPKVTKSPPKKAAKRKRARSKDSLRSKYARDDELQHGWQPTGETFKRPILKPVSFWLL